MTYEPMGWCRKCGYRTDPGVCPECGEEVSEKDLLRGRPRFLTRRRLKFMLASLSIAAVLGIAWGVIEHVNWVSLWPDSWLIEYLRERPGFNPGTVDFYHCDPPFASKVLTEVRSRVEDGSFDKAQLDRLWLDSFHWENADNQRKTVPASKSCWISFKLVRGMFWSHLRDYPELAFNNVQVQLDGKAITTELVPCISLDGVVLRFSLPEMDVGDHPIIVSLNADIAEINMMPEKALYSYAFRWEGTVTAVDPSTVPGGLAKSSKMNSQALLDAFQVTAVTFTDGTVTAQLCAFGNPCPIAGRVCLIREDGKELVSSDPIIFDENSNSSRKVTFECDGFPADERFSLRLVPDGDVASIWGLDEYFDMTLVWDNMTLADHYQGMNIADKVE